MSKIFDALRTEVNERDSVLTVLGAKGPVLRKICDFSLGYGNCLNVNEELVMDDLFSEKEEEFYEEARKYSIRLPAKVEAQLREIARLNEQARKIGETVTEELEDLYNIDLNGISDNPLLTGMFTSRNFVSGEVKETESSRNPGTVNTYLYIDRRPPARANEPGHYVHQITGCCGDDFSGEEYIATGKKDAEGKEIFVCWDFDF